LYSWSPGIDPLDEATRQILAENDELLQVEKGFLSVGGQKEGEEEVEEVHSEGVVNAQMMNGISTSPRDTTDSADAKELDADVLIQTALSALSELGSSAPAVPSVEDLERERALIISEEKERERIIAVATGHYKYLANVNLYINTHINLIIGIIINITDIFLF
jgi:hypothetical protein